MNVEMSESAYEAYVQLVNTAEQVCMILFAGKEDRARHLLEEALDNPDMLEVPEDVND